jgi:hypothetical protein
MSCLDDDKARCEDLGFRDPGLGFTTGLRGYRYMRAVFFSF